MEIHRTKERAIQRAHDINYFYINNKFYRGDYTDQNATAFITEFKDCIFKDCVLEITINEILYKYTITELILE
jgi:hypothetical protein